MKRDSLGVELPQPHQSEPIIYWAHSDREGRSKEDPASKWQLLSDHLQQVGKLAYKLARNASPHNLALAQMAGAAGFLHDFGKYQACFQMMLDGTGPGCPHAIYGAFAIRNLRLHQLGPVRNWALPVVNVIAAHHAGLKNAVQIESLTNRENPSAATEVVHQIARQLLEVACLDQPLIKKALDADPPPTPLGGKDLFTRILLSCLVDADRLNTAGHSAVQAPLRADERLLQLTRNLKLVRNRALEKGGSPAVLAVREEVQHLCKQAALGDARLLSLSVPTGGGKTLAAMRFALERARAKPEEVRRIIVVIPFLSIIEQNAKVYRDIFGEDAVLEHHSGAVYQLPESLSGDRFEPAIEQENSRSTARRPLETENWDAPMIVTTSVRFFESLFSNHPSDLRRVHNIARSVIIFDEVQTLPRRLLAPLLGIIRELTHDWGCTVVMATATQPAFEARTSKQELYAWPKNSVTPIVPDPIARRMQSTLRRVQIEWRTEQPLPWTHLVAELRTHSKVLCVVNLRDHASLVYDALVELAVTDEDRAGIFHLSSRMCAQHRLDVLSRIKVRLESNTLLTCRVVSTQLIEAGVDLSVPIAYRALGPLDAIVQVAGRVDREGTLTEAAGKPSGRLIVFRSEDDRTPPGDYKQATGITSGMAMSTRPQTDDLEAMQQYFEQYYGQADSQERGEDLARMREDGWLEFATLAEQFEYINTRTKSVFVPYRAGKGYLQELSSRRHLDLELLRKLQRFTVGLQPWEFDLAAGSTIFEIWPGSDLWTCNEVSYDSKGKGILPDIPAEKLVR